MREAFREAALRYRPWSNFYYYSKGKLALDPAYPVTVRLLKESPRPLVDLGCGMGLLASCLRAAGHRERITGVDVDAEKISVAQQVLGQDNAEFLAASALDMPAHSGDVVMLDVLHYFDDADQQKLLDRIAQSVAPGGLAVFRMATREPSWRFMATRMEELIVKASRWIPMTGSNFPTREEVVAPFQAAGFSVEVQPMWGWTPFNGYLFVFRRPEA